MHFLLDYCKFKIYGADIVSSSEQSAIAYDWEPALNFTMARKNINAVLQMFGKSPVAMHSKATH